MDVAPRERTLPALLARAAERYGERVLARAGDRSVTFAAMPDVAARRAGSLAEAGVRPGDRVAVLGENRLEVLELWLGCAWLGAVFVPVNTALRGFQLEHVLATAAPRLVVELEREELPPAGEALPPHPSRPGDTTVVLFTSGTTGPSKGVLCPHAQWYWWGALTGDVLGVREGDVLYTCLPLFHTNALNGFCQALLHGAAFVPGPRFSATAFWQRLVDAEATVTYLLGPMVSILLERPPSELDRAHRVRVALAPATRAEHHGAFQDRFGFGLVDAWGSTETSIVLSNRHDDLVPGTMGCALEQFEACAVDSDDEPVPDGTPGELAVRPREPFSFATGYLGRPEATVEAWRNLWFHTGDRVVREADGRFRFVDRLKEVIRRRGENVSAWEVEHVLEEHPDVVEAAAIPVPSELGEDEVMACVVLRKEARADAAALLDFCAARLAHFAVPRYVDFLDELPRTATGRVEKYRLRERGVTPTTWDRDRTKPSE